MDSSGNNREYYYEAKFFTSNVFVAFGDDETTNRKLLGSNVEQNTIPTLDNTYWEIFYIGNEKNETELWHFTPSNNVDNEPETWHGSWETGSINNQITINCAEVQSPYTSHTYDVTFVAPNVFVVLYNELGFLGILKQ